MHSVLIGLDMATAGIVTIYIYVSVHRQSSELTRTHAAR